jgi:hypothetical protein
MNSIRIAMLAALLGAGSVATAQQGIQLSNFPLRSAADGRSTITITAIVRNANGTVVADGTLVNFTASQGRFRQDSVPTQGGVAQAVYVAGNVPGLVKVTASALVGNVPPASLQFELVSDRSLLSSAQEYVEVFSDSFLEFAADTRYLGATAPDQGVFVRYRDVQVDADDIQFDSNLYVLRAKNARLRLGKIDQHFEELYLQLNMRTGQGITAFPSSRWDGIYWNGHGLSLTELNADNEWEVAQPRMRVGPVKVELGRIVPIPIDKFDQVATTFQDMEGSPSTIRAKKAVVFPNRGVQFQKAEVYVGETRVLSMPMYELNFANSAGSPLVTDQFVSMWNNSLSVNYPYFVSVKPGQTSLFRFRTGEIYGRSSVANRGMFLDYELNWNKGDEMDGAFGVQGIGRDDWVLTARQSLQIGDRAQAFVQAQTPGFESVFGSFGATNQFNGFTAQLNGNVNRTLRGLRYTSQDYLFAVEKDPIKLGKFPAQLNVGVNAAANSNSLISINDRSAGVYARLQSNVIPAIGLGSFRFGGQVRQAQSRLRGNNTAWNGSATLVSPLSKYATVTTQYDYVQDGVEDQVLGNHRVSMQGFLRLGNIEADISTYRALERDRLTIYGSASYLMSRQWRLGYSYTFDRFNESQFVDYFVTLGYTVGWREVGLIWSRQTGRIGFQVLGSRIY